MIMDDTLTHYGVKRRSGRYPWGSGDVPYQHEEWFLNRCDELKKSGMTEKEIADSFGLTTSQLRIQKSLAKSEQRQVLVDQAKALRAKGLSLNEIANRMGYDNDSSVRSLLNENSEVKMLQAQKTADFLKKQVDEKGMIDVGTGVERDLGVSREKLNQALYILELQGYNTFGGGVPQVTNPGKQTNIKVLCPPDTEYKINANGQKVSSAIYDFANIHSATDNGNYISHDDGETFDALSYPKSMDSSRLKINYGDQGGLAKDGLIEIRRGVPDLNLGNSHYAQVRILVDDNKYLKGMAIYSDNMPDGVDVVFNTNKKSNVPKTDVLKDIEDDPVNPFGSTIKADGQSYYTDENGNRQLSLINKTREEGDWNDWSDGLPSQFLSKQPITLVKKQLNLTEADKQAEYDEICSYNNPTVKKVLLQSFADDCDAAAVHLKAAALPRQKYQVILPVSSLKDDEVYAPNYKNGEKVALVRYPHGGTFEIPILTVNNKQKDAKALIGNGIDAIGVNHNVADKLSGADFDGDTVTVIPCNSSKSKVTISSRDSLEGLKDFDPKIAYATVKKDDGYYNASGNKVKIISSHNKQKEMGVVSNLITDMTLKGATDDELARAVRHSMVIIDAEKHHLDYKQSAVDNDIASLKKKYQGTVDENGNYHEGAATLISRAKSPEPVLKRRGNYRVDPETGARVWNEVHEEYTDKKGNTKVRTQQSTKMDEVSDARILSSGTPKENLYADYANKMKSLGNQARKEILLTGKIDYDRNAKKTYQREYDSLMGKLNTSLKNAPRERQAQLIANSQIKAMRSDNPDMTPSQVKKAKQRALTTARIQVGAKRTPITITDREWEAIQAGAISENKLKQILDNTDMDSIKKRATPRSSTSELSQAKQNKIASMNASGYSINEIAEALGCSTSTVWKYLK